MKNSSTYEEPVFPADRDRHLMLLRIHVSRNAADKWKPVLEGIGFDSSTINACKNEKDEEAVQTGLTKWIEGKGQQPPTWRVLLEAMKYANIGVQYRNNLRTELGLPKEDEGEVQYYSACPVTSEFIGL